MSSIPELVARLNDALDAMDWMGREMIPTLRPPASDKDIAASEAALGRPLPPSYKEFLELHNGMEGLEQYDWGIAGCTPVAKGDDFDDVRSGHLYVYKDRESGHPAIKDLKSKSPLVGSDFDYEIAYFTLETLDEEEPEVRRLAMDKPYDHFKTFPTFKDFLAFVVEVYEDLLALQGDSYEGDFGGGELGGLGDDQLLMELASLLGRAEPEEEPEPVKLSPEMERASRLVRVMMQKLIDNEFMELVEGPGMFDALEDYLLKKLLRSTSQRETIQNWIKALSKAREVEELYGTDEDLAGVMNAAFDQIAAEN